MNNLEFNKITWYSKLAAVIFFIGILPAWAFYVGVQYEATKNTLATEVSLEATENPPTATSVPAQNSTGNSGTTIGTVPGCSPSAVTTTGSQEKSYDLAQSLPVTFKISYTETKDPVCGNSYTFNTIQVIKNGSIVQTLQVGSNEGTADIAEISNVDSYFQVQDMNFDGYKDIGILEWAGTSTNSGYYYWLYNPQTGLFELNNDLSQMTNPSPNYKLKEIITGSDDGDGGLYYETDTYSYSNGKYVLIKSETQDQDEDDLTKLRKVVKELENGVMATTSDTIVTPDMQN